MKQVRGPRIVTVPFFREVAIVTLSRDHGTGGLI